MSLPNPLAPVTRLRIFAAVTIASAAAISFESIRHLALTAGFGWFSWLFPATLDAVAAYGMDLWVRKSPAWKQARALALAAIGGSLVANVVDHWLSQRTILPAVLGAIPPGMLAALLAVAHRYASGLVHAGPDSAVRDAVWRGLPQAVRSTRSAPVWYSIPPAVWSARREPDHAHPIGPLPVRRTVAEPDHAAPIGPMPGPRVEYRAVDREPVRPKLIPVQRTASAAKPRRSASATVHTDAEITEWIKNQDPWPTKAAIMDKFGVGSSRALRLRKEARDGAA